MTQIIVPFIVFASLTAWILGPKFLRMWHEQRMKELEARNRLPPALPVHVPTGLPDAERKLLEERIRTLETIVCSVDYELNAKLNRLASRQLQKPPTIDVEPVPTLSSALTVPSTPPPANRARIAVPVGVEPGHRLAGRFLVERALGQGGMGTVFLAHDEKLGERVAIKVVRDAWAADPTIIERFKREVTAARRIHHPNVVRLHDMGEEGGMIFLSMEHVAGQSLAERLHQAGKLGEPEVRTIASQLCDGLAAVHEAGVIHRDLKPSNVLLSDAGPVKIIDFGVAKLSTLDGMTATSLILGTPEYMAPEQIRGGVVDARTDLYAVGMVLHEALTGSTPFHGDSPIALGFAACSEPVPPLPGVSAVWDTFVRRALAKDPSARFGSAKEMRAALPR